MALRRARRHPPGANNCPRPIASRSSGAAMRSSSASARRGAEKTGCPTPCSPFDAV